MGAFEACSPLPTEEPTELSYRTMDTVLSREELIKSEQGGGDKAPSSDGDKLPLALLDATVEDRAPQGGPPPDPEAIRLADLTTPFRMFHDGIRCVPGVAVRVGPVVGKVTDTSVVILVETEVACDITVNVARIHTDGRVGGEDPDEEPPFRVPASRTHANIIAEPPLPACDPDTMSFDPEGAVTLPCHMLPRRPHAFVANGLKPGTGHIVLLGGVCQDDMLDRIAFFRTLPRYVNSVRLLVLGGHSAQMHTLGALNPWQRLLHLAKNCAEMTLTLHIGHTVDVKSAITAAAKEVTNYTAYKEGPRKDMVRRARYAFRNAYHEAWGRQEGLRRLLARTGSHLSVFNPSFDVKALRNRMVLADDDEAANCDISKEEVDILGRLAVEVYFEYERKLWYASLSDSAPDAVNVPAECEDEDGRSFRCTYSPDATDASSSEHWHFHRYGTIYVLSLDVQGQWLEVGAGRERLSNVDSWQHGFGSANSRKRAMMSSKQWIALARALSEDDVEVLVVLSSAPFLVLDCESDATEPEPTVTKSWLHHTDDLDHLLKMLFDWKQSRYPAAEVIMVSGSAGYGVTGDIRDCELGLSIPVVATGPVLGPTRAPADSQLLKGAIGSRFNFSLRPPVLEWNACIIEIDVSSQLMKPSVDVEMVNMKQDAEVES